MKKLILIAVTVASVVGVWIMKPIAQNPAYHIFADTRSVWGIPNGLNVISNVFFLVVGVVGLQALAGARMYGPLKLVYATLFAGILLTGIGSGYYHLKPDNDRLVFDRLPMAMGFMALLAGIISEFINFRLGILLAVPLILLGLGSVFYWHYTEWLGRGDLRLYGFVQFFPVLFIPLTLLLFPSVGTRLVARPLGWVVVWYVIAKLLELFDRPVYEALHFVSGHSLKHIAAAVSTWYLVRAFKARYSVSAKASPETFLT